MTTNYDLFKLAIIQGKQVVFTYKGHRREACPHTLGTKGGLEKALTFQFAGGSSKGLPPGGEWRCLFLSEATDIELRDGPWHTRNDHSRPQTCVDNVHVEMRVAVDGSQMPYIQRA